MNTITHRMSGDEAALWTQLSTFSLDGSATQLSFAARLARENGWSPAYTQRVLAEYRRFLFLCCVTPAGVTPSDPVDQAWHLHLTYTRSYWVDLCQRTLGRDLHHNPTKGGAAEGAKFDGMYTHSQDLYRRYFGENPPPDVWPANQERFSDIDFARINRRTHWVIGKPVWHRPGRLVAGLGILGVLGLFVQANSGTFLFLVASAVGLFIWLRHQLGQTDFSNRDRGGDAGGGASFFTDSDSSHHNAHGHDGHSNGGDGGHGGDAGCSASGCSSGCSSGCGGGCGGGGD